MFRIFGCLLTVTCAMLWGMQMCTNLKRKEKMTAAMCDFIKNTGDKIGLMCMPLSRIFAEYDDEFLCRSGFLKAVTEKGGVRAAADYAESFIPGADKILMGFFSSLGEGDKETEEKLCRAVCGELSEKLKSYRESLPGKLRIYKTLPLMMSLCAVILII